MLYKKNSVPSLSKELFENPTSEYRCTPFWSWNCKLDKEELLRQIEVFKEMGMGGFHIHSRTGLETEHLSDEFMSYVKDCIDKAEAEGMLGWLYDEDRWSSGPAGGKVTKHKPFRRKRLMFFPEDKGWNTPKAEALESGESYLLGVYDVKLDKGGYLAEYRRIPYGSKAKGDIWYAYCVNEKESPWFNYQTYVDCMDEEAIATFIRITHDRYNEVVGDRFGKSVPAIFTDEPNANHETSMSAPEPFYRGRLVFTWTRFFEEKYKERYGQDILDVLPEVVWDKADRSDSLVKYRYHNFIADQFAENYNGQIGKWCAEHGIAYTGHFLREPKLYGQIICNGDIMRQYKDMGIPGIDMLCGYREYTTVKQCQSIVHQYGKEAMLSELYGVTNWDFDFRGHKLHGDWQAALGVTVRVPHLAWVSMKGEAKRDYPAAIGYQSPWYKEYSYIENHFARVNAAMTRGRPIVKIGVIHPTESMWLLFGPTAQNSAARESAEQNFANITNWMLKNHLDFDFIGEQTLSEIGVGKKVGVMEYDTVVLPSLLCIRQSTLDWLVAFQKLGGKVVVMGDTPSFVDGIKNGAAAVTLAGAEHISFDLAALCEALKDNREISIRRSDGEPANNLLTQYRADGEERWLFIAYGEDIGVLKVSNTLVSPQVDCVPPEPLNITVKGEFYPTEYNTLTGEIKPLPYKHIGGDTVIPYTLYGAQSLLLKLSKMPSELSAPAEEKKPVRVLDYKRPVSYTLSEPNVLLLDRAEYKYDDGAWQPEEEILRVSRAFRESLNFKSDQTQPYAVEISPATHSLALRFTVESEMEVSGAHLALEDAGLANVTLNGEKIAYHPDGYFTDKCLETLPLPTLPVGTSTLEICWPYGERTNVEWCYLLGDFGVRVMGCACILCKRQEKIGFGDITPQTLPFYGANIEYHTEVELEKDGSIEIELSNYRGSLVGVSVDGKRVGRIVLPPYTLKVDGLKAGKHTVTYTLFGNRHNSFGALHNANPSERWFGPKAWRTAGDKWSYEYKLKPLGILKSPIVKIYE